MRLNDAALAVLTAARAGHLFKAARAPQAWTAVPGQPFKPVTATVRRLLDAQPPLLAVGTVESGSNDRTCTVDLTSDGAAALGALEKAP